jgi:hypothetical protein
MILLISPVARNENSLNAHDQAIDFVMSENLSTVDIIPLP